MPSFTKKKFLMLATIEESLYMHKNISLGPPSIETVTELLRNQIKFQISGKFKSENILHGMVAACAIAYHVMVTACAIVYQCYGGCLRYCLSMLWWLLALCLSMLWRLLALLLINVMVAACAIAYQCYGDCLRYCLSMFHYLTQWRIV